MTFYLDIEHAGLRKFRRIRGSDQIVVQRKATEQLLAWDDQWSRKQEIDASRNARNSAAKSRNDKKALAQSRTAEAQSEISDLRKILAKTMGLEKASWTSLYDRSRFNELPPRKIESESVPPEPKIDEPRFQPQLSLLSKIIPYLKRKQVKHASDLFATVHALWQRTSDHLIQQNKQRIAVYNNQLEDWQKRKNAFKATQDEVNQKIDDLRKRHLNKDENAITEFTDLILSRSEYPDFFPKRWEISFDVLTGVMVVDYDLPDVERIPKLAGIKYVQVRDALEEVYLKDKELDELFEGIVYQTCLRTVREVFASDLIDAIKSLTFNGYVDFIDRTNGKPARSCIVSLQATKKAIDEIDFNAVDPKACFRALKGVGSAKLSGMAAVIPILKLNRVDNRFVPARDVIDNIDQAVNIAAIPWEDFEHLVRDIFEKEFSTPGGEVKITRASRDHGVDAIAFDPDPIRGGKIVIQAKRYTNPVGVSAVRDLYGTLINEGANRGILVTTSVYGPDSYDFAKDKPITLLNGGHLLHLLEKHGHPARIDLREAKLMQAEKQNDA
jgi:restriction system protein